jgi:molecular chaperone DnaK (HSP70)
VKSAEEAKIKLSTELEVEIVLPFFAAIFSFSYKLLRAELEQLTKDVY